MIGWLKRRVRDWLYWTIRSAIADEMGTQFDLDARMTDRYIKRLAVAETVEFLRENGIRPSQSYPDRVALMNECLRQVAPTGLVLEFGVYKGTSISRLADHFRDRAIYGFDSFEGLPEAWVFGGPGQFADAAGRLPRVPANVNLLKGWFEDTLPRFLAEHPGPVAFLHVDCDLYSSTACILRLLSDRIVPGTVILFDELIGYPGWKEGEYKAFREWVEATGSAFEYLGYVGQAKPGNPAEQAAIKVLEGHQETPTDRAASAAMPARSQKITQRRDF